MSVCGVAIVLSPDTPRYAVVRFNMNVVGSPCWQCSEFAALLLRTALNRQGLDKGPQRCLVCAEIDTTRGL